MKKLFIILGSVLLTLVSVAVVVFFGFDKKIPTSWANGSIEAVKTSRFGEDGKMPKSIKYLSESILYSYEDGTTTATYTEKTYFELKNNSTDEAEGYEIKNKTYDEHGELIQDQLIKYYIEDEIYYKEENETKTQLDNFGEIALCVAYISSGFYETDGTLNSTILAFIDNNLNHVSQKGTSITLHLLYEETMSINIVYNFASKRVTKIEGTADDYQDGVLKTHIHKYIEF